RGDPADAAADQALSHRTRTHGPAGADASAAFAAQGALRRTGRDRAAGKAGPDTLGPGSDRRGARPDRQGDTAPRTGYLPGAGGDRRAACPRRDARGYRLA